MNDNLSLAGRSAIVTGAGGGLGAAILGALADRGAFTAGVDIVPQNSRPLGDDRHLSLTADVADEAACERAIDTVMAAFGSVDILVNCAGITGELRADGAYPRFWERRTDIWRSVQAVNHNGAFHMAYHAVRPMMAKGWGRIINVSTSLGTMLAPGLSAYGPSKAAMEASSAIWAEELAGTGVTVNVLLPGGPVATAFVPPSMSTDGMLKAAIMGPPAQWIASQAAAATTGYRFIARDWDSGLSPAQAAARCSAPAGWKLS